jgi:hypothetical protein
MNGRGRTAVPSSQFPVPSERRGQAIAARREARGEQNMGPDLQEKQIRKSQVLAKQGLTTAIFIFKARNCHWVEGEHERRPTAGR